jgi:hypothetical protein
VCCYLPEETVLEFGGIETAAKAAKMTCAAYRAIAALLPPRDDDLDRLMAYLVEKRSKAALMPVLLGALDAERAVDARHLERAAGLMPEDMLVPSIAARCTGDVDRALLKAARRKRKNKELTATCLLAAAWWRSTRSDGPRDFADCVVEFETLHSMDLSKRAQTILASFALLVVETGTPNPWPELTQRSMGSLRRRGQEHLETFRRYAAQPVLQPLAEFEKSQPRPARPRVRRADGRKVGRNDPCPCGSGRKFKKCCGAA